MNPRQVSIRIVRDELSGEILAYVESAGSPPRSGIKIKQGECRGWKNGETLELFGVINEVDWSAIDVPRKRDES